MLYILYFILFLSTARTIPLEPIVIHMATNHTILDEMSARINYVILLAIPVFVRIICKPNNDTQILNRDGFVSTNHIDPAHIITLILTVDSIRSCDNAIYFTTYTDYHLGMAHIYKYGIWSVVFKWNLLPKLRCCWDVNIHVFVFKHRCTSKAILVASTYTL